MLWVDLAVFETDARSVKVGTPVSVIGGCAAGPSPTRAQSPLSSHAGREDPTLTARVEFVNRDGALRPGHVRDCPTAPPAADSPERAGEAVLPTGTSNLVFVNRGDGSFMPREVAVGARGDSLVEIVQGLKTGRRGRRVGHLPARLRVESRRRHAGADAADGHGARYGRNERGSPESGKAGQGMEGMKTGGEDSDDREA